MRTTSKNSHRLKRRHKLFIRSVNTLIRYQSFLCDGATLSSRSKRSKLFCTLYSLALRNILKEPTASAVYNPSFENDVMSHSSALPASLD